MSVIVRRMSKTATGEKKAPKPRAGRREPAARKPAKRSHLEVRWAAEWNRQGGPELVEEFGFHPTRKWRADFAHLESRTLIEIEGGAAGGRHTRKAGFEGDMEKYLTAFLHGWEVVRIGAALVRGDIIAAVIGRIRQKSAEAGKSAEAVEGEDDAWDGTAGMTPEFEGPVVGFSSRVEGVDDFGRPVWLSLGASGLSIERGENAA